MRIVIITGLSGSGKSTAVKALEDEGFFCLDNLPAALIPTFVDLVGKSGEVRDVALVMDIRGKDFFKGGESVFQRIGEAGHDVEIFFFEATDQVLIRRFSETRRRHPALESGSVPEGIRAEREQLAWLRRLATMVVDTSELNVHQLKEQVIASVKGEQGPREGRDRRVPPQIDGHARIPLPLLHPGRKVVPDHFHRLHRRQTSFGGDGGRVARPVQTQEGKPGNRPSGH